MGFATNKSTKSRATLSEINVTPLVDVMLVLLIMFMVTTPLMQQGINVDLPRTAASGVELNEEPLVLVIDSRQVLTIAKTRITPSDLKNKLAAIMQNRKNKQVYIQADRKVDYGFVAECMAEIKSAGVTSIGLITLPKDK
ncbi:MAG: ExbD/TolR family protein [Pseudobdellovibrionaceae bacterium]|jgi:biopolymer transport protein TolR